MGVSGLQTTWTELRTELARFLGYDRTEGNWTDDQVLDLAAIIKRGLRQFYFPQPTIPGEMAHRWTFLRPQAELVIWDDIVADDEITVSTASYSDPVTTITASDDVFYPSMEEKSMVLNGTSYTIDEYVSATIVKVTGDASGETGQTILIASNDLFTLPWDFGGLAGDGRFTYDVDENKLASIRVTADAKIRLLRQTSTSAGTPYLAAIVPLGTGTTQAQRWAAQFHPPPNDAITLHYRYHILPDALTSGIYAYPYGSAAHSETLLESCLAIAESREKDSVSTEHQDRYKLLLQGSIDHDKQLGEAVVHFGYNGDNSDEAEEDVSLPRHNGLVTYEGNTY